MRNRYAGNWYWIRQNSVRDPLPPARSLPPARLRFSDEIGVPESHHPITHHQRTRRPHREGGSDQMSSHAAVQRICRVARADRGRGGSLLDHVMILYGAGLAERQLASARSSTDHSGGRRVRHNSSFESTPAQEGQPQPAPTSQAPALRSGSQAFRRRSCRPSRTRPVCSNR